MTIKIKIGQEQEKKEGKIKYKINVRKSINGDLIIREHNECDIIIQNESMKVIAFARQLNDDSVYDSIERLFEHLRNKGIIEIDSIRSGNVFGSLEGKIQKSNEGKNSIDLTLLVVSEWLEKEKPSYMYDEKSKDNYEDYLTDPDEEDSTDLGEIPHPKDSEYKKNTGLTGMNMQRP